MRKRSFFLENSETFATFLRLSIRLTFRLTSTLFRKVGQAEACSCRPEPVPVVN